jgi:hypothetical protein
MLIWAYLRRRIIIVIYDPSIAILSEAEQIVVLKGTNEGSKIVANGAARTTSSRRTNRKLIL